MASADSHTISDNMDIIISDGSTWSPVDTQKSITNNVTVSEEPPEGCVVLLAKPGDFIPWNNPDNLISQQVQEATDTAVAVVFFPILFSISLPCNILNMIVFCKQGLKERINLCLFSLSLADSLYMLYSFVFKFDAMYSQFTKVSGAGLVFEFIVNNHLMFIRGMNWVSGFLSMMIACERCFCVFSPLRSQQILKTKTTGVIILVGAVLMLGLMTISTTRWSVVCVFDPVTHTVSKATYPSQFYLKHQKLVDTISGIVLGLLLPGLFTSVVTTTTILTFVKLRQIVQWREQTSSVTLSSREILLTRMLIGVSVLYVICTLPLLPLCVCFLFVPDISVEGRYFNTFKFMLSLFDLFSYINTSVNFFVYCCLGSRFKETLKEICFQCCGSVTKIKHGRALKKKKNVE